MCICVVSLTRWWAPPSLICPSTALSLRGSFKKMCWGGEWLKNHPVPGDERIWGYTCGLQPLCAAEAAGKLVRNANALARPLQILTQRTGEGSRNRYFPLGPPPLLVDCAAPQTWEPLTLSQCGFDELSSPACPSNSLPLGSEVRGEVRRSH